MLHFKLPSIVLLLLVATALVSSQSGPNLQTFSERVFGQRVPAVVRSGNRFSVISFNQVRSTSSDLRFALRTSCDIYFNICLLAGRRQVYGAFSLCSASAQRCRNSISESVRRAGSQTGSQTSTAASSTSAGVTSTTASQAVTTSAATSASSSSAATSSSTTTSSSSASAATTTASVNNLVDPVPTGGAAASTSSSASQGSTTATSTSANAVPTQVEVAPPPLVIPNMSQFCAQVGQAGALADGTQKRTSTCSQTAQGQIPAFEKMVSTLIIQPANGATIQRGTTVPFSCTTSNMETGFFDDPQRLYYAVPQTLNADGVIQGHQHISVQRIASATTAPDPSSEALSFFVGLNTKADAQGMHTATIPATTFTQPGVYRICTITGTRGHQPVIMPVARRGSQDDCIRVNVV